MNLQETGPARRVVCGWCPTPLPDDWDEWHHHFLVQHAISGHSVRFYANDDDPLEDWFASDVHNPGIQR